jgi:hypothetical protein
MKMRSVQSSHLDPTRVLSLLDTPIRTVYFEQIVRKSQPCTPPGVEIQTPVRSKKWRAVLGAVPEVFGDRNGFVEFADRTEFDALGGFWGE